MDYHFFIGPVGRVHQKSDLKWIVNHLEGVAILLDDCDIRMLKLDHGVAYGNGQGMSII